MSKRSLQGEIIDNNEVSKRLKLVDQVVDECAKNIELFTYEGYNRNIILGLVCANVVILPTFIKLALIFFNNGTNMKKVKNIIIPGTEITVESFVEGISCFSVSTPKNKTTITPNRLMQALAPQLFYLNLVKLGNNYRPSNIEDLRISHLCFASLPFKQEIRVKFDQFRNQITTRISSMQNNNMMKSSTIYAMQISRCMDWSEWDFNYLNKIKNDLFEDCPAQTVTLPRIPFDLLNATIEGDIAEKMNLENENKNYSEEQKQHEQIIRTICNLVNSKQVNPILFDNLKFALVVGTHFTVISLDFYKDLLSSNVIFRAGNLEQTWTEIEFEVFINNFVLKSFEEL